MKRYLALAFLLIAVIIVGTGCGAVTEPPNPHNGFWEAFFVYPLYFLLVKAKDLLFGQWGLAILVVTLLVRLLILPLTIKQYKSTRAMQLLQPELKIINEKYKDNPQKRQEETMKLFQKSGVNPLAGCLPLLIQMPILFAFYRAIMGVNVSHPENFTFLWLDLSSPDPFYILPIVAALTTYLQMKISMAQTPQGSPQMNQQMKMMYTIMPFFILFIGITLPSALALYWVFGNIISIAQTYLLKDLRTVPNQEGASK